MSENYLSELEVLLSKKDDYTVEGKLNKNKVAELAHKYDAELIDTLAGNKGMRKLFFVETQKDVLVFNKDKFIHFISNKEFLPDSFTAYKNKIGLATGMELLTEKKEVVLNWPYKDAVLEGGQDKDDAKRNEVFHNEVLAPDQIDRLLDEKVFTGFKRYDKDGEHKVKEIADDDNLIIRGNNLLALHSLKRRYAGKVKLIYIDPPYNTGSDSFGYNDSFNHSTWLTFMRNRLQIAKQLLARDGVIFVQSDDNEQAYLKVLMDEVFKGSFVNTICVKAKASSGASGGGEDIKLKKNIEYIHCYYNEEPKQFNTVYQQTLLADYIAERVNDGKAFAYTQVLYRTSEPVHVKKIKDGYGNDIEVLAVKDFEIKSVSKIAKTEGITEAEVYEKYYEKIFASENAQTSIRDRVLDATDTENTMYIARYKPVSGKNEGKLTDVYFFGKTKRLISFLSNVSVKNKKGIFKTSKVGTLWDDLSWSSVHLEGGVRLDQGKKPEKLLHRIIDMASEPGDIVMDYHLGSGTTAAVAHKMGRKFIGIEQLDYAENDPVSRLATVVKGDTTGVSKQTGWMGGGSFVYTHLMDLGNKFVQNVKNASSDKELTELLEQAKKSSFLSYKVDPEKIDPGNNDFDSLSTANKKQLLLEIVDHNHLYVNYTEIDDKDYGVSAEDKKLNKQFYEN